MNVLGSITFLLLVHCFSGGGSCCSILLWPMLQTCQREWMSSAPQLAINAGDSHASRTSKSLVFWRSWVEYFRIYPPINTISHSQHSNMPAPECPSGRFEEQKKPHQSCSSSALDRRLRGSEARAVGLRSQGCRSRSCRRKARIAWRRGEAKVV